MNTPTSPSHDSIARRAHQLWEAAGRPDGLDLGHWLEAEREERELNDQHSRTGEAAGAGRSWPKTPASGQRKPDRAPHSANYAHPGVTTDSLHHQRAR
jgi:hypothetical protein